jgi:hypothetical protein
MGLTPSSQCWPILKQLLSIKTENYDDVSRTNQLDGRSAGLYFRAGDCRNDIHDGLFRPAKTVTTPSKPGTG